MSASVPVTVPGGQKEGVILNPPLFVDESARYRWFFTIKFSLIEELVLTELLGAKCQEFTFQAEVGTTESSYEHYQGVISLKKKERFAGVLGWLPKGTHLEAVKNYAASIVYCMKDTSRMAGHVPHVLRRETPLKKAAPVEEVVDPLWLITALQPWQQEVVDISKSVPDRRTIHWYWSVKGNLGRTQLCKYLCFHFGAVACQSGEHKDVLDLCTKMSKNLKIALWNFGRAKKDFTYPYLLMEEIKDGLWFSGKFETGMVNINSPHVFVFANSEPQLDKMSLDRWHIVEIK